MGIIVALAALWYLGMSLCAFLGMGFDKLRAKQAEFVRVRRVPEKTLHAMSLLGGFFGVLLGMRVFVHKTRKPVFSAVAVAAAVLHACGWIGMIITWRLWISK